MTLCRDQTRYGERDFGGDTGCNLANCAQRFGLIDRGRETTSVGRTDASNGDWISGLGGFDQRAESPGQCALGRERRCGKRHCRSRRGRWNRWQPKVGDSGRRWDLCLPRQINRRIFCSPSAVLLGKFSFGPNGDITRNYAESFLIIMVAMLPLKADRVNQRRALRRTEFA